MARRPVSLVPSPEILERLAAISPSLAELSIQLRENELRRQFTYAIAGLAAALVGFLAVIAGYIFLVIHQFPEAAGGLLGAGMLALIMGFIRARLQARD
jgi:hypothetical protein